jgi:hypothetical protein
MADQPTDSFSSQSQETPAPSAPSSNPYADQLGGIKDPSTGAQKYGNVEEALKGLSNAQEYIPQLKSEISDKDNKIQELQAELDKRSSVEDVVSRLTANQNQDTPPQETPQVAGLDEQAVQQLVYSLLSEKEQETALKSNRTRVNQKLNELYGEKAPEVIATKAGELGLTPEKLGELASESPDVVLALFNSAPQSTGASPTTTSHTNTGYKPPEAPLEKPTKSLLQGATAKEQEAYMLEIQKQVYEKYGVEV